MKPSCPDNQLVPRPPMNIMRCPSTFSMHTFLWREYSR
ncbi:hypothetical protein OESDEN_09586 [Oesophagostomum dentatum]|uniref:Uncharacterized protein n=1 Tax=Oesophagostomum dentatum TaxID=61180 RepID=A0A0B1T464_OESDE|nr:hypothetical protein OESDEN_09586 [Oesophagostomum dentatum]